jgi:hypothetical protein
MKILIACEHTASLSSEFRKLGHDVTTCDLKKSSVPQFHHQGNLFDVLYKNWDLVFAFPPCTFLAKAQMHLYVVSSVRSYHRDIAVQFVKDIYNSNHTVCIENPVGYLNNNWKKPNQIIRPWHFGDPYDKEICLWYKNCPPVLSTLFSPIRKNISNHTNGRMSQALKSEIRSSWSRYPMMCKAIATQYSNVLSTALLHNYKGLNNDEN